MLLSMYKTITLLSMQCAMKPIPNEIKLFVVHMTINTLAASFAPKRSENTNAVNSFE